MRNRLMEGGNSRKALSRIWVDILINPIILFVLYLTFQWFIIFSYMAIVVFVIAAVMVLLYKLFFRVNELDYFYYYLKEENEIKLFFITPFGSKRILVIPANGVDKVSYEENIGFSKFGRLTLNDDNGNKSYYSLCHDIKKEL